MVAWLLLVMCLGTQVLLFSEALLFTSQQTLVNHQNCYSYQIKVDKNNKIDIIDTSDIESSI